MRRIHAAVLVHHHVGVAVVGDHQRVVAVFRRRAQQLPQTLVHRLRGADRSAPHPGVPHHVGVGVVEADEVRLVLADVPDDGGGYAVDAHLRFLVVGLHVTRTVDQDAPLPGEGILPAATEEESNVSVFLRLRDTDLRAPRGTHHLPHGFAQVGGVEEHPHVAELLVVLRHAHVVQALDRLHMLLRECLLGERARDLSRPVGTEVETDHHVPFPDGGQRFAVCIHVDDGFEEFVGGFRIVVPLDGFQQVPALLSAALHQCVVRLGDPLPARIAVHGVETAGHRGDFRRLVGDVLQYRLEVTLAGRRRYVPSVREGVDIDLIVTRRGSDIGQVQQVIDVAVDPAVAHQPNEVDGLSVFAGVAQFFLQGRQGPQLPLPDGLVDPREALVHHAAGPDVEVAYLGITHLPLRKAHFFSVGDQGCVRIIQPDPVEVRGVRLGQGIRLRALPESPSVQDDEERFRSVHGFPGFAAKVTAFRPVGQAVRKRPFCGGAQVPRFAHPPPPLVSDPSGPTTTPAPP